MREREMDRTNIKNTYIPLEHYKRHKTSFYLMKRKRERDRKRERQRET